MSILEVWQALAIFSGLAFAFVSLWNVHLRRKIAILSKEIEVGGTSQHHHNANSDEESSLTQVLESQNCASQSKNKEDDRERVGIP